MRVCKDCGAADRVTASLDRMATHQIHPATQPFFKVFLERAHFKQPGIAPWQKLDQ